MIIWYREADFSVPYSTPRNESFAELTVAHEWAVIFASYRYAQRSEDLEAIFGDGCEGKELAVEFAVTMKRWGFTADDYADDVGQGSPPLVTRSCFLGGFGLLRG
jgi:hypothetical protein